MSPHTCYPNYFYHCTIRIIVLLLLFIFDVSDCANTVVYRPVVECHKDAIFVGFQTQTPFEGRVFIRGQHTEPNCHTGATHNNNVSLLIPHLDCAVSRTRSLNPLGITMGTKVVISFHPNLVTRGDQVFVIECFYLQKVEHEIALDYVPDSLPSCIYQVQRFPGKQGVRYAELGERLVHSWSCQSDDFREEDQWCILVHNCYMTDSGQQLVNLTDSLGCTLDPSLMPNIYYHSPAVGVARVAAAKFPGHPHVRFNCQISANAKIEDEDCERPLCPKTNIPNRFRRSTSGDDNLLLRDFTTLDGSKRVIRDLTSWLQLYRYTQDVASDSLSVLDIEESLDGLPEHISRTYTTSRRMSDHQLVCVGSMAFAVVVSAIFVVAITTIIIITVLLYQRTFV